jgi:hypothetical protein
MVYRKRRQKNKMTHWLFEHAVKAGEVDYSEGETDFLKRRLIIRIKGILLFPVIGLIEFVLFSTGVDKIFRSLPLAFYIVLIFLPFILAIIWLTVTVRSLKCPYCGRKSNTLWGRPNIRFVHSERMYRGFCSHCTKMMPYTRASYRIFHL